MDISIVTDQTLAFSKHALNRSSSNLSAGAFHISGMIFPVDAVAPPPVRLNALRSSSSRTMTRRKRRTKKRSSSGDEDGGGGPFSGGGGGGWNFGGYGDHGWEEESGGGSSSSSSSDFMHEVICWIALSNCVHFAFKKVLRILAASYQIVDDSREKVPIMRSLC